MIIKNKANIKSLQKFIGKNFKKNHILSKNQRIFNWLYYNKNEKKYNFILEQKNKNIISFLGIIKNSKFNSLTTSFLFINNSGIKIVTFP